MHYFLGKFRPYNKVKTPVILQLGATECGIAALAIILAYYKVHVPFEKLREECGSSRDGSKATTLITVAKKYGLMAEAFSVEMEVIAKLTAPVIAFWNFNHFVVINGVGTNKVFINDPAQGLTSVSLEEFNLAFTGIIILFTPAQAIVPVKKPPVVAPFIKYYITNNYSELSFIFMGGLLVVLCPLLNSGLSRTFIDDCVLTHSIAWLPYLAILAVMITVIFVVATWLQKASQFKWVTKLTVLQASKVVSHLLQLPLLFYSIRHKSEMISVVSRIETVAYAFFNGLFSLAINLLMMISCFILMAKIDVTLSMVSLFLILMASILFFILSKFNLNYEKYQMNYSGKYYSAVMSSIRNIETIKACHVKENNLKKWRELFLQKINVQDKINTLNAVTGSFGQLHHAFSLLSLLCLGGYRVSRGDLSVGELMAYYALHLFFSNSIYNVFQAYKESQRSYVSHVRVNDMMHYEKDSRFLPVPVNYYQHYSTALIICRDLYFYYNKSEPPTLKNINLNIYQGEHIALIGKTGSGKSTLAKLLCALYQPHAGEMFLADRNIVSFNAEELASYFAYVAQDISLFSGTLLDNLTFWKKSASLSDVVEAVHDACLDDLVSVRGLHAKVEENGNNFSGGERQRIDIARALIQNTPIMILDEATSALDAETEAKIIENLRKKNKTIIFVTHRLSAIQHCDQVWTVEDGMIHDSKKSVLR